MDEAVSQFVAVTDATPEKAARYLHLADGNVEQAIMLFFDSPNLDVEGGPSTSAPAQNASSNRNDPIRIDSDDDMTDLDAPRHGYEDDEALARRLQEEDYGGAGPEPEVRAPMARTTETLVGPGAHYDDDDVDAAVQAQLAARRAMRGRPGIFNQQAHGQSSVWDNSVDAEERRRELATATGGASEASSKSNLLAQMYRPPFEILWNGTWDDARDEGKAEEKWLLVNIQDPAIFDCQVLNRDIWKNEDIKSTVRENFIFLQYNKDEVRGQPYINYYFQARDSPDAYPHIAIVDPRTGEQVKVWSGPPVPKPIDFHAELHEFLDRYSLKPDAKNPVAKRKPESQKKDIARMTEEEMLEMAMQASLRNGQAVKDDDPDALTKDGTSSTDKGKGKAEEPETEAEAEPEEETDSRFASISDSKQHTEPDHDPATTTRIKFTYSGQAKVRRFFSNDKVRIIYEWIKSGGWEGKEGADFELLSMRKNLIDHLDETIAEAGLKGSVVNVEFVE